MFPVSCNLTVVAGKTTALAFTFIIHHLYHYKQAHTHTFKFFHMWITRLACPNTYLGTLEARLDKQAGLPRTSCVCTATINKGSVQCYRVEICCFYRAWDMLPYFCRQLHSCSDSAEKLLITAETFLGCCIKALQWLHTHLKVRDTYIRVVLECALWKWG